MCVVCINIVKVCGLSVYVSWVVEATQSGQTTFSTLQQEGCLLPAKRSTPEPR